MDYATETYVTGRTNAVNHKHQMVYYLRLSYKQMMLYLKKKSKTKLFFRLGHSPSGISIEIFSIPLFSVLG